mmetsp:Transcript_52902/g.53306  ORF Transcript_52902/g.53306 Transcript_52902/m.53306 type:complete len:90 (-) Transcript_52902:121-390(-)
MSTDNSEFISQFGDTFINPSNDRSISNPSASLAGKEIVSTDTNEIGFNLFQVQTSSCANSKISIYIPLSITDNALLLGPPVPSMPRIHP